MLAVTVVMFLSRNGVADRSGLRPGDGILRINHVPATYLDHEQAKMEIIRSGNELDFVVQRNAINAGQNKVQQNHAQKPRSVVDEESTAYKGYTNPNVQSRSFKILQESLNYSEAPQGNNIEPRGFGYSMAGTTHPLVVKRVEAE